jgi:erythromycin esterase-like protein/predicted phosphoribosyltransferase
LARSSEVAGRFRDRAEAGRALGLRLRDHARPGGAVVLGLAPGGVPVAAEVANALGAPLDAFLVRDLPVPGHDELSFGAITTGGLRVLNTRLLDSLALPADWIEAVDAKERRELERRERVYRGDRPPPDLTGHTAILVDDGTATPATLQAAVLAIREDDPACVVVAIPVPEPDVLAALRDEADDVVSVKTPEPFRAAHTWFEDFRLPSDEEIRALLERAPRPPAERGLDGVQPLRGELDDYDGLVDRARGVRFVLIGEASHGTDEFYRERAEITRRLIAEAGFTAVAVEADWPDAYRVNRYVQGEGTDTSAEEALGDFRRFPTWMWRNTVVEEFVTLLREYDDVLPKGAPRIGFYGLDLYSLHTSMEAVVRLLEQVDPEAAERARERYACFDHFGRDPQVYAYETGLGGAESCEAQAVAQLVELQQLRGVAEEDRFYAEQNARLVANAEEYYRSMFRGGIESWNLRDTHMADTLDALVAHLERTTGEPAKVVVWAHNSHLGDARATELGQAGEINLGQLVRERAGAESALLIGFTTFSGTVTAASDWDRPAERKRVRRALPGSWEELFHGRDEDRFLVDPARIPGRRIERAIGVVYRPETERASHYFQARLADQFDAVIHIDETHALEPLGVPGGRPAGDVAETYPWGV